MALLGPHIHPATSVLQVITGRGRWGGSGKEIDHILNVENVTSGYKMKINIKLDGGF